MERLILTNGNVIRPTRIESGMAVVCRNGRIERILPGNGVTPEPGDRVIDARGGYIAPGFIDMHVHGGGGYDFMDGTVEAFLGVAETHARYGTTALVPTTLTCTDEELYRVFEVFREADRCNKRGARLLGLHYQILKENACHLPVHRYFYEKAFHTQQIYGYDNKPFHLLHTHSLFRSAWRSYRSFHQSPELPADGW